jgi:hypothetical protein
MNISRCPFCGHDKFGHVGEEAPFEKPDCRHTITLYCEGCEAEVFGKGETEEAAWRSAEEKWNRRHTPAPTPAEPMNVREILVGWLKEHGYDGIFSPDGGCSCSVDDMPLCDLAMDGCRPGYKVKCRCGVGCDFDIAAEKEEK